MQVTELDEKQLEPHAKLKRVMHFAELAQERLAADMYPLSTQVQIACHQPLEFFAPMVERLCSYPRTSIYKKVMVEEAAE
mgnify:CR=1 FL=1